MTRERRGEVRFGYSLGGLIAVLLVRFLPQTWWLCAACFGLVLILAVVDIRTPKPQEPPQ